MTNRIFRDQVGIFTTSFDALEHQEAIIALLDPLDLDIEYKKLAREGGIERVQGIFSSFADTGGEDLLPDGEQMRLEEVGRLTDAYLGEKQYSKFAQMIFQLLLESFFERYDFGVDSIEELQIEIVYAVIPEEIQLQTLLLESMANTHIFNWSRDAKIIEQSLITLTVCFSDVYTFLSDEDFSYESD